MKAVVMAGGQGTRARPITHYLPKAMIPVRDRPLIEHITDHLEASGAISEIVIVADVAGLGAQISHHYSGHTGKRIAVVQDSGSGTGGDILHAGMEGESEFLLWFSDNLCALDVSDMVRRHASAGAAACVATRSRRSEETGFAQVQDGMVVKFMEKPILELPYQECLGIYVLSGMVLEMIRRRGGSVNLSYDILQNLPGESGISAYDIGDIPWVDVESPAALLRNAAAVDSVISQMGQPNRVRTP